MGKTCKSSLVLDKELLKTQNVISILVKEIKYWHLELLGPKFKLLVTVSEKSARFFEEISLMHLGCLAGRILIHKIVSITFLNAKSIYKS